MINIDLAKIPPQPESVLEEIRILVEALIATGLPRTIILFGSRARGDFTEDSDIDICVIIADDPNPEATFNAAFKLNSVVPNIEMEVDVVCATESDFKVNSEKPMYVPYRIKRQGIVIWQRDGHE